MEITEKLRQIRGSFPPALTGPELHRAIAAILRRHVNPGVRCFLFGSEARGAVWPSSDIDIGLVGNGPIPAVVIENIHDELDRLPTLRLFDIVDFADVSSVFREQALKNAIDLDEQRPV